MLGQLAEVGFIEDADVGAVLVDDHETGLHRRHDVASFVLIMERGFVFYHRLHDRLCRHGGNDRLSVCSGTGRLPLLPVKEL